jgi:hypothetical protein
MRLPRTLATESRAVPARSEASRMTRPDGAACVGRSVARADGHDVEARVRRGRVALSPHWAPIPSRRTAAHAGDARGLLLPLAPDCAARDLSLAAPALNVLAARQLVPDLAAEDDAVVSGQGGQPQLVQHAPPSNTYDHAGADRPTCWVSLHLLEGSWYPACAGGL